MVDIQTVSIVIASAGVFVAAMYYILQIRHQTRLRESDVVLRLSSMFSVENMKAFDVAFNCEFQDYDDFIKRYGTLLGGTPETEQHAEMKLLITQTLNQMDTMGLLLKRRIVDADLMYDIYPGIRLWEKVKPLVDGVRKELNDPNVWICFEYYSGEMKKRQQQLASKPA
jgi:hypothetical protein